MKKIIITLLASFIGMSAMAATAYCDKEVAATIGYTDETFYVTSTTDGVSQGTITVYSKSGNLTGKHDFSVSGSNISNASYNLDGATLTATYTYSSAISPRVYLVFKRNNSAGGSDITGFEIAASLMDMSPTACGGAVDPEPAAMLPVDQAATKFQGAGLQIIVTGYGCAPESAYGCNDDFTIELAAGNTIYPTGDRVVGNTDHVYYACNTAPAAEAVNKYTLTHVPTGHCATITMTGSACTAVTACSAATGVSITEVTPGVDYIDLEWEIMGYDPTHAYILYKKASDANFTRMVVAINKPTARITGLAANTDYVVKVRLEQQDGEGAVIDDLESEEETTKTASASMSLKQVGAYTNYLTIGWDVNFTAELYTVMYRKNGSKEEFLRYELSGAATSATITGLNEHTAYEVQVVAQLSAAQGGSRTATGVFTTLHRTSCNTVSYESEQEDGSFTGDLVCEFKNPYNIEAYTMYDNAGNPTVRIRYQYRQGTNYQGVELFKRNENDNNLITLGTMPGEGNHWYYKDIEGLNEGDYFYFAVKVVSNEACTSRNTGSTINQGGMYVTRKLNYKVGVGCNDATELEFTKGEGDKVFYLQSNATIARVEVYNPSDQLVDTPEITKPGPNYVLNIADNTAFPTGTYTFKLYDINGRLSDVDLVYTIY